MNDDQNQTTPTTPSTDTSSSPGIESSSSASPLDLGSIFDGAWNITTPPLQTSPEAQSSPISSSISAPVTPAPSPSLTDVQDFTLDIDLSTLDTQSSPSVQTNLSASTPVISESAQSPVVEAPISPVIPTPPIVEASVNENNVSPVISEIQPTSSTSLSETQLEVTPVGMPPVTTVESMPIQTQSPSAPLPEVNAPWIDTSLVVGAASLMTAPSAVIWSDSTSGQNADTPEQVPVAQSQIDQEIAAPGMPGGFDIDKMLWGLESNVWNIAPNPLDVLKQTPLPPTSGPTPQLAPEALPAQRSFFSRWGFMASVFLGLLFLGLGTFYLSVKYPVEFSWFFSQFLWTWFLAPNPAVWLTGDQNSGMNLSGEVSTGSVTAPVDAISGSMKDTESETPLSNTGSQNSGETNPLEGLQDVLTTGQAGIALNDQLSTQQWILSELIKTAKADKDVLMLKKLLPVQKNLTNLQEQVKNGSGSLDDLQDQIDKLQKELGQLVR